MFLNLDTKPDPRAPFVIPGFFRNPIKRIYCTDSMLAILHLVPSILMHTVFVNRRVRMGILAWIILGGIAGWIASMLAGKNGEQGILGNIIVGIIGAFIGGFIF